MKPDKDAAWSALAEISKTAWSPRKGKLVNITRGKHKGESGVVFWHGKDRYRYSNQYQTGIQSTMSDILGRFGFRIGVKTDSGEKFFVSAEYAANPDCPKCEGTGFVHKTRYCYC